MRAKSLAARQSGRSAASDGRLMLPASTSSVTLFARSKESPHRGRADAAPGMRHVPHGVGFGRSFQSEHEDLASGSAAGFDEALRQTPASCHNPDAYSPFGPLGWQMARLESARMNSMMSSTGPMPLKRSRGLIDTLDQCPIRGEQELIGIAQTLDIVAAETAALHADDVEPAKPRPVTHDLAVGDDVALHSRHAPDHRVLADPHILMDGAQSAENGVLLDDNMTGERGVVRHDDGIADLTVMGDMSADHE